MISMWQAVRKVVGITYFPFKITGIVSKVPPIRLVGSIVVYGFFVLAALVLLANWLSGGPTIPWKDVFRFSH